MDGGSAMKFYWQTSYLSSIVLAVSIHKQEWLLFSVKRIYNKMFHSRSTFSAGMGAVHSWSQRHPRSHHCSTLRGSTVGCWGRQSGCSAGRVGEKGASCHRAAQGHRGDNQTGCAVKNHSAAEQGNLMLIVTYFFIAAFFVVSMLRLLCNQWL